MPLPAPGMAVALAASGGHGLRISTVRPSPREPSHGHRHVGAVGVLAGIGESLLHDPVRAAPDRHRHGRRIGHPTLQLDPGPGPPCLGGQLGQVGQRGLGPLRRVVGPVVTGPVARPVGTGSARSTPITARSSSSAWWALSRITPAARAISSAGRSGRSSNAPACRLTSEIRWASTSCISRAIRSRSCRRACATWSCSARRSRSRSDWASWRRARMNIPHASDRREEDDAERGLPPLRRRVQPDQHGTDAGDRGPGRDQADHREPAVHRHGEQRDDRHPGRRRRHDTEHDGGDREADRPAPAQPHTQTAQPAEGDVHGERHRAGIPVPAVDVGERREPHGQQENRRRRPPSRAATAWRRRTSSASGAGSASSPARRRRQPTVEFVMANGTAAPGPAASDQSRSPNIDQGSPIPTFDPRRRTRPLPRPWPRDQHIEHRPVVGQSLRGRLRGLARPGPVGRGRGPAAAAGREGARRPSRPTRPGLLPQDAEATRALVRDRSAFPGSDAPVAVVVYVRDGGITGPDRAAVEADRAAFAALARTTPSARPSPATTGRQSWCPCRIAGRATEVGATVKQIKQQARRRPGRPADGGHRLGRGGSRRRRGRQRRRDHPAARGGRGGRGAAADHVPQPGAVARAAGRGRRWPARSPPGWCTCWPATPTSR